VESVMVSAFILTASISSSWGDTTRS
jgi:hypothetical protein